jgi:L-alanine-DL-glutamate epimerase-like enolase superfamily enzyme
LFSPSQGTLNEQSLAFDFGLHDLAGIILNKPVYAMMGAEKPVVAQCYSGMIYFDEMEPENKPAGLGKILENCQFDYDYGYRQLKVKIGRGGKWMSKDEGLKTDIAVTRMIFENFPDCNILVDGNDAFTVDYFISYLEGIEDVPLFWIEEPFRETREDYAKLKKWLINHGRRNTLLADGETNPDLNFCLELGREQLLDVYIDDISGYGFTPWRKLVPRLKETGMMMSPHAWGDTLKSFYCTHLTGAYGNTPTIEGVTSVSDDIDLSAYQLVRGRITPPSAPGFGMKLIGK